MLSQVYFAKIARTQQPYFFELSSATTNTCQTLAAAQLAYTLRVHHKGVLKSLDSCHTMASSAMHLWHYLYLEVGRGAFGKAGAASSVPCRKEFRKQGGE